MNAPLRGPILRAVSRSFYLSIRLLPAKLRDPIALAYLLARATDTIADTAEIQPATRMEQLVRLAALVQDPSSAADDSFRPFATLQKDTAERTLITELPRCLAWLAAMPEDDRAEIRRVLAQINEGQALDVQRFGDASRVIALKTAADLDRYTYLVAGCVGEFWTNICFFHLPNFSERSREEMMDLGIRYGKGLQLINILRDLGADLRAGRCYLPAEELHSLGLEPSELQANPSSAQPLLAAWSARAEEGINAGVEYACSIRNRRVRLATVLPALIGARTLALLRAAEANGLTRKVKVPRAEVRRIVARATLSLASATSLREAFARYRK